jgi:hypothetical protein
MEPMAFHALHQQSTRPSTNEHEQEFFAAMTGIVSKVNTALALGIPNILRVVRYRLGVKTGFNPVRRLQAPVSRGPFFTAPALPTLALPANPQWQHSALWFGHWPVPLDAAAPDWHRNPLTGASVAEPGRDWWHIPDFDPAVGDIKGVWEGSRMNWALALAQAVRTGQPQQLGRLNTWLADWCANNPPYKGPNWKCGQEASIRVMQLAMAAQVLGQVRTASASLRELIHTHLQRIAPTIDYAIAQDNNHGSSEAAALFIGGSWLGALGDAGAVKWQASGLRWLENRAARLLCADGSFSQYSLTYHRMALDTYSMAEQWRRQLGLAPFSARLYQRAAAATDWLHAMVDPVTGDAPNVGANDGAHLFQLSDTGYRDFRPSVELAMALFRNARAYPGEGGWRVPLAWLGLPLPEAIAAAPGSVQFDDGGFAVLRQGGAMAMLRYPRFRFRPSQADGLHVDLWLDGINLLRDAGSYSYNAAPEWLDYFPGTGGHNTVQFDGRDQMPRLSRFLYSDWLATSAMAPLRERDGAVGFEAAYRDSCGATHARALTLGAGALTVRDRIAGFARKAVLRWRLAPGPWQIDGNSVRNGGQVLAISATMPIVRFALVQGWESRYYSEKTSVPVLEVEVQLAGELTSTYRWST